LRIPPRQSGDSHLHQSATNDEKTIGAVISDGYSPEWNADFDQLGVELFLIFWGEYVKVREYANSIGQERFEVHWGRVLVGQASVIRRDGGIGCPRTDYEAVNHDILLLAMSRLAELLSYELTF
jgi:hypothetical protein